MFWNRQDFLPNLCMSDRSYNEFWVPPDWQWIVALPNWWLCASITLLVCLCDARRVHKAYNSNLIKLLRVDQLTGRFKIPNRFVKLFLGPEALPIRPGWLPSWGFRAFYGSQRILFWVCSVADWSNNNPCPLGVLSGVTKHHSWSLGTHRYLEITNLAVLQSNCRSSGTQNSL